MRYLFRPLIRVASLDNQNSYDVSISKCLLHNLLQAVDYPQRRYRINLRSTMGPIDVYLVRYWEKTNPTAHQKLDI